MSKKIESLSELYQSSESSELSKNYFSDNDEDTLKNDCYMVYNEESNLTEQNLRKFNYLNYIKNLPQIKMKYWEHTLKAIEFNELNLNEKCIEEITIATKLVLNNKNITENRIYKLLVIYYYIKFVLSKYQLTFLEEQINFECKNEEEDIVNYFKFRSYSTSVYEISEILIDEKISDIILYIMGCGMSKILLV